MQLAASSLATVARGAAQAGAGAVPGVTLGWNGEEQLLSGNVERFRGVLVSKAHKLLYHPTLGSRVMKQKKKREQGGHRRPLVHKKGHASRTPAGSLL